MKKHETTAAFVFGTLGMVPLIINPIYTLLQWVSYWGPKNPLGQGVFGFSVFGYQSYQTFGSTELGHQRLGMMSILHL